MSTTEPIRNLEELIQFREYYHTQHPQTRNYALIMLGLHSALRISDLLRLKWKDVYDFERNCFREHLSVIEHKTQKHTSIALCKDAEHALNKLFRERHPAEEDYNFRKRLITVHLYAAHRHTGLCGLPQSIRFSQSMSAVTHCARPSAIMPGNRAHSPHC